MAAAADEEDFVLEIEDEVDLDSTATKEQMKKEREQANNSYKAGAASDAEAVCSGQAGIKGRQWAGNMKVLAKII